MISKKGLTSSLRHKIIVEKPLRVPDGAGGYSITWENNCTLWAAISTNNGKERYVAGKNTPIYSHVFRIRYTADVSEEMRIHFDERVFNIRALINVNQDNSILDVMAEEGVAQ